MSAYAPPGSMAWSVPQYPAAMPAQSMPTPPLKFFLERNDGSLVPLVPVDELPDDVRLLGVPSTLDASQVKDMLFLGREPSARIKFSHARSRSIRESEAPSLVAMDCAPHPEMAAHNGHAPQVSHNNSRFCCPS